MSESLDLWRLKLHDVAEYKDGKYEAVVDIGCSERRPWQVRVNGRWHLRDGQPVSQLFCRPATIVAIRSLETEPVLVNAQPPKNVWHHTDQVAVKQFYQEGGDQTVAVTPSGRVTVFGKCSLFSWAEELYCKELTPTQIDDLYSLYLKDRQLHTRPQVLKWDESFPGMIFADHVDENGDKIRYVIRTSDNTGSIFVEAHTTSGKRPWSHTGLKTIEEAKDSCEQRARGQR